MANPGRQQTIPDYSAADAKAWVDKQGQSVMQLSDVLLIVFGLLGLAIFILGIVQYMRERREAAFGGGGQSQYGLWMMVVGGALGAIDLIMLLLVGIVKPPGS